LLNIPSDVQPDWFELAVETAVLMTYMEHREDYQQSAKIALERIRPRRDLRERFHDLPYKIHQFEKFFSRRADEALNSPTWRFRQKDEADKEMARITAEQAP
jgi:hypothetical protein